MLLVLAQLTEHELSDKAQKFQSNLQNTAFPSIQIPTSTLTEKTPTDPFHKAAAAAAEARSKL